jgi:hypothetical protein
MRRKKEPAFTHGLIEEALFVQNLLLHKNWTRFQDCCAKPVATETFLVLNGGKPTASDEDIVDVWTAVGAGQMSEDKLAEWL